MTALKVGQHWRGDDNYVIRIVGFAKSNGWPIVRHVNAKQGGWMVNPAWFELWTCTKP